MEKEEAGTTAPSLTPQWIKFPLNSLLAFFQFLMAVDRASDKCERRELEKSLGVH